MCGPRLESRAAGVCSLPSASPGPLPSRYLLCPLARRSLALSPLLGCIRLQKYVCSIPVLLARPRPHARLVRVRRGGEETSLRPPPGSCANVRGRGVEEAGRTSGHKRVRPCASDVSRVRYGDSDSTRRSGSFSVLPVRAVEQTCDPNSAQLCGASTRPAEQTRTYSSPARERRAGRPRGSLPSGESPGSVLQCRAVSCLRRLATRPPTPLSQPSRRCTQRRTPLVAPGSRPRALRAACRAARGP